MNKQKKRWRSIARRVAIIAGGLFLLHLLVVNVLLRTRILRDALSGSPDELLIDYEAAYSIIPGRVHIDNLAIRTRDGSVEWLLRVDRCDVRVALHDLLRRRFHTTRVRADGVEFRVRMRLDTVEATPERVAAQPTIAGFPDPPYKEVGPPPAPVTDDQYRLWTVFLEDVDAVHVREAWIDAVRTAGDMHVRGRWFFRPLRWLDLGPATVEANALEVTYGKAVVAVGLRGTISATIAPHDMRSAQGAEIFRHVSAEISLRGVSPTPSAMDAFLRLSGAHVSRAGGPVDGHIVVDHGRIRPGTFLRAEPSPVEVSVGGVYASASLGSEVRVEAADGGGPVTSVDVHAMDVVADRPSAARATAAAIDVSARAGEVDLTRLGDLNLAGSSASVRDAVVRGAGLDARFAAITVALPQATMSGGAMSDARVDVDVSAIDVRDLRALNRLIPASAGIEELVGTANGTARASFAFPARTVSGRAAMHAPRVSVRAGRVTVASAVDAAIDLKRGAWAEGAWNFGPSEITLRALTVSADRAAAGITVPTIALKTSGLAIDRKEQRGAVSMRVPRAVMPDIARLATLVSLPKGMALDGGFVVASLAADLELPSRAVRGHARVDAHGLAVRVGARTISGDVRTDIAATHTETAGHALDLTGTTVDLRNVRTSQTDASNDGWWAHLDLSGGLRLEPTLAFDAVVRGRARDAQPAAAIVAANTAVPEWVAGVFRMTNLRLETVVRASKSSTALHSFVAQGDTARIRLEYETRSGVTNGALLAELGELAVGFDLSRGASIVLINAESWFVARAEAHR